MADPANLLRDDRNMIAWLTLEQGLVSLEKGPTMCRRQSKRASATGSASVEGRWLVMQEREHRKEAQLKEVSKEALQLRNETGRLERLNNNLQGYGLDDFSNPELNNLVNQLNQVSGSSQLSC